jgi:hypothetical protein
MPDKQRLMSPGQKPGLLFALNPLFTPSCHSVGMTYARDTTAISEIAGQSVSTWAEE